MLKQSCHICYYMKGLNPLLVVEADLDKKPVCLHTYSPADCMLLLNWYKSSTFFKYFFEANTMENKI